MAKEGSPLDKVIMSSESFILGRGDDFCRGCLGTNLFSALNLGELPIANELLITKISEIEKFPLHLKVCSDCGLGQVADVVKPDRIFRDYRYLSSMSTTFLQHASHFVDTQIIGGSFSSGDWVLEIASNDGYLLKNFLTSGIKAIGVEPAENVAEISRSLGVETITEFFSNRLAIELFEIHGYPKLIIANNVMAHVPDLIDFIRGLSTLCGPDTRISIENPSLENILIGLQFDTIYHEHYSYLSASAVSRISEMNGLQLVKVEKLPIHGGSNRYWLQRKIGSPQDDSTVGDMIRHENDIGLFEVDSWRNYSSEISRILNIFQSWLASKAKNGEVVFGYGAAAKASTILNSINIDPDLIMGIGDVSLEKQKRFMPPHGIEIISPAELFNSSPKDIIIFPWNIKDEIASYLRSKFNTDARFWCAIPEMHEI